MKKMILGGLILMCSSNSFASICDVHLSYNVTDGYECIHGSQAGSISKRFIGGKCYVVNYKSVDSPWLVNQLNNKGYRIVSEFEPAAVKMSITFNQQSYPYYARMARTIDGKKQPLLSGIETSNRCLVDGALMQVCLPNVLHKRQALKDLLEKLPNCQ